ncbi:MAG: cell division protein FtsH [Pirellulaceae bacterium]|nr:cell division protein FtsH [Pirellulaceae bacterium]
MDDDDETLTAYHEAGHAVIGYALGARIERVQLGGEADDHLPERFGDCLVNWGMVHPDCTEQRQRELMTILAGPVAEMIYRGEPLHPAHYEPWQGDWQQAWDHCRDGVPDPIRRTGLLEQLIGQLHRRMSDDDCWAAVAAVADELLAHEFLDEEQLSDTLAFWLG